MTENEMQYITKIISEIDSSFTLVATKICIHAYKSNIYLRIVSKVEGCVYRVWITESVSGELKHTEYSVKTEALKLFFTEMLKGR